MLFVLLDFVVLLLGVCWTAFIGGLCWLIGFCSLFVLWCGLFDVVWIIFTSWFVVCWWIVYDIVFVVSVCVVVWLFVSCNYASNCFVCVFTLTSCFALFVGIILNDFRFVTMMIFVWVCISYFVFDGYCLLFVCFVVYMISCYSLDYLCFSVFFTWCVVIVLWIWFLILTWFTVGVFILCFVYLRFWFGF